MAYYKTCVHISLMLQDPWRTPQLTCSKDDNAPLTSTHWCLPFKNLQEFTGES